MRKKFDRGLYNANDPAKQKAIEYFKSQGVNAIVNPDDYGIDLIVDGRFYCEVEVKHNWRGDTFPFSTLQIPERKMKFVKSDMPVVFMVMNSDHSYALLTLGEDVMASPLKEVPNKFVSSGEMFFQVPTNNLLKINL
jgi:hypothetical protein